MEKTFINFTNHPSELWNEKQTAAAKEYGNIIDIAFPQVDPNLCANEITALVDHYVNEILKYDPSAVLCQGEFTLCYNVIKRLKEKNINVFAACSNRMVVETQDEKLVRFEFVRFREY